MIDETTDLSNTEQMIFCLRYVDDDLLVHEEVIGLYCLENTSSETIVSTVKDILLRLNLTFEECRGQCYDGASNMSGTKSGVVTRIMSEQPKALYSHCYGHSLNLACQDGINTVYEITKLIKRSPKRDVIFKKIKDEVILGAPGIRVLCPTRWTVRAEALTSISENYEALQLTWEVAREATRETEMRSRIDGVAAQMRKFDFFFGVVLNMVDNLSRALQAKTITANQGQHLVSMTLQALQSIRKDVI